MSADNYKNSIINTPGRSYVYLDVRSGMSQSPQRVIFELFDEHCPKTCENFRQLCCGVVRKELKGDGKIGYVNSLFHRVVKGQFIQGGDICK